MGTVVEHNQSSFFNKPKVNSSDHGTLKAESRTNGTELLNPREGALPQVKPGATGSGST